MPENRDRRPNDADTNAPENRRDVNDPRGQQQERNTRDPRRDDEERDERRTPGAPRHQPEK